MRVFLLFILVIFLFSCQKDALNPYDDPSLDPPQSNDTNYFNKCKFMSIYVNRHIDEKKYINFKMNKFSTVLTICILFLYI